MRKLLVLPVIAVVAVAAAVGGISVASANHNGDGGSAFTDRIAEILGIAPEDVSSAFAQARSEAHVARMESRLADAVAADVITEEEAAAISDWFAGKPEALQSFRHYGLRSAVEAGEIEAFLADLVVQEIITPAESEEISGWFEGRPPVIEQLREWRMQQFMGRGHHGFGFRGGKHWGRGHGGGMGGHGFCDPYADPDAVPEPEVSDTAVSF